MKLFSPLKRALALFVGAFALLMLGGCATTEPENMSERPWNTPKSWEHGLPTSIMRER